ncbi:MAG: hypothetical protein ACLFWD_07975 [Anaerolineales bacterium]
MQRKNQIRNIGIVLLVIGTGIVGVLIGVYFFLTNPGLVPAPTPPTATPITLQTPLPANTPQPGWVVTYEYRFSPDLLNEGQHAYQIGVNCPGELGSGTYSGSFTITGSAQLHRDRVYARPSGLWDSTVGGNRITAAHPDQAVGAAVTLRYDTLDEAEAARDTCDVNVQLDSNPAESLDPAIPREER